MNGIAKVKVCGYSISSTESSGKFGDVELSATGTTVIDIQFHDGVAEIPLTLTVPGKQMLTIEIVDLKNSARSVEIEVIPIELKDALLFKVPDIYEMDKKLVGFRRDYLFRQLI